MHLPIPEGPSRPVHHRYRSSVCAGRGGTTAPLDLGEQTGSHHRAHPFGDSCRQRRSRPAQPELDERHGWIGVETGSERTERTTAADGDLEGAHDPALIGRLHLARRDGVEFGELSMERGGPFGGRSRFQLGAHVGPAARHVHRVGDAAQVQPGAGDQYRSVRSIGDAFQRCRGCRREIADRELFGRVDQIEAVMRHCNAIGSRRLGGADVHAPVDLHRVDGDQFGIGVTPGQRHGDVALARCCGPQDDYRFGGGHPASTAMRRLWCGWEISSTN
jgi:hypothetical protein